MILLLLWSNGDKFSLVSLKNKIKTCTEEYYLLESSNKILMKVSGVREESEELSENEENGWEIQERRKMNE